MAAIKDGLDRHLFESGIGKERRHAVIGQTVDEAVDAEVTREIIENKRRVDGRKLDRDPDADPPEVELLPRNHGARSFSAGRNAGDVDHHLRRARDGPDALEGIEGPGPKRYMHHYNFPPYSVGETKPMRGWAGAISGTAP